MTLPTFQRGLTLVELLLGLALGALLLMPLAALFRTASQSARASGERLEQTAQARFAARRIATEVRGAAALALPDTPDDTGAALAPLRYWVRRTGPHPELMESDSRQPPATRDRVLATSASLAITAPDASDGGQLVTIVVTTSDAGSVSETVRLGSDQ